MKNAKLIILSMLLLFSTLTFSQSSEISSDYSGSPGIELESEKESFDYSPTDFKVVRVQKINEAPSIDEKIPDNPTDWTWMIITLVVGFYEVILRVIPTSRDWTLIGMIYKLMDMLVSNRETTNKAFKIKPHEK